MAELPHVPYTAWSQSRTTKVRIQAMAQKHWLGVGASGEQKATVDEIRRQYFVTASEYLKTARALYDSLDVQNRRVAARKAPFTLANRNVQLFLAYTMLWESFNHLYTAASYTHFAKHGPSVAPLEDERTKIARVLGPSILDDGEWAHIMVLKNGETPNSAMNHMLNRSSRELQEIYGVAYDHTLTDMNAFLQGVVEITETQQADGNWQSDGPVETWAVQARNSAGQPIDPDSPFSAEKYRSVITWHCYQIRNNLNFIGKSEGSIDDAILIIRAFCLVEPVVSLLLHESRKPAIFAL